MDWYAPFTSYFAGLITILNPCVLPVLPIVLATALREGKLGPVAFAAGLSLTFTIVFILVSMFGNLLGVDERSFTKVGAVLLIAFGLLLLVPGGQNVVNAATGWLQTGANRVLDRMNLGGLGGQFAVGAILGLAWSPCIGPTLGSASTLALSAPNFLIVLVIALAFSLGVSTILLVLSYGSRQIISERRQALMASSTWIKPVTGTILLIVGLMLMFNIHYVIEAWILSNAPQWLLNAIDFSASV